MEIHIEVEEAERRWTYLENQIAVHGARVVLLVDGKPIGAILPKEDYDWLQGEKARRAMAN